jgi:excisionase family DNA binding protein
MAKVVGDALGISEAAERLGITVEAVRQRIRRGKLEAYKDQTGCWQIVLPPPTADQEPVPHAVGDEYTTLYGRMVGQLESEVEFLRGELERTREQWSEESRRKDLIIAELAKRIPALPSGNNHTPEATPPSETSPAAPAPRPWWKFWSPG